MVHPMEYWMYYTCRSCCMNFMLYIYRTHCMVQECFNAHLWQGRNSDTKSLPDPTFIPPPDSLDDDSFDHQSTRQPKTMRKSASKTIPPRRRIEPWSCQMGTAVLSNSRQPIVGCIAKYGSSLPLPCRADITSSSTTCLLFCQIKQIIATYGFGKTYFGHIIQNAMMTRDSHHLPPG